MNGVSIKYFVITIASIFVALGVGILIGFSVNSEKFVQKQFQQQLSLIDKNLVELKKENDRLLKEIDEYKSQINQLGKINDTLVNAYLKTCKSNAVVSLIVTSTDYSYNDLIDFLRKNQIKLARIVKVKRTFVDVLNNKTNDFSEYKLPEDIINTLALYAVFDMKDELLTKLTEKRYIEINRLSGEIADTILIAGGNTLQNDTFNAVDRRVIEKLRSINDLNIVGVEQSYSEINYCEKYKSMGLDTVDNVDELTGKVSLIELIRGGNGNYGTKKEANLLMPNTFTSIEVSENSLKKRREGLLELYQNLQSANVMP
ncbi:copper transporter [Caldicellulosiruptor acetigenus]|uniref:copper transporter n=1 Tax=Caldicellulosiruptor acetigenus TaxID=301953 RepID=UPI000429FEA8|nr:copper transporter [Caldicellulosiruptor acetigenus]WAM35099.1 copper transporter [Caldicellulosiruptor acetigenus]